MTRGAVSFTETDEVGLYTLSTARGELRIAVNLMDADESNLEPRPLPQPRGTAESAAMPVPLQRELWPLFVALAGGPAGAWRACSTGGARAAGGWTLPTGAGDRWALGVRCALVVVLALTLAAADAAAVGGPAERRLPARRVRQRQPGRPRERAYRFANESLARR